jgi:hypothetical protein
MITSKLTIMKHWWETVEPCIATVNQQHRSPDHLKFSKCMIPSTLLKKFAHITTISARTIVT